MLPTDVPERFLVVVARGPPRLRPTHTLAQPRAVAPRRPSITAVRGTTASHALYRIAPLRPPPPLSHRSARRHVVQPQPPYHHVCHTHPLPWRLTETHRQSAATPGSPTTDDSFAARPRPLGQSTASAPSPDRQLPLQQVLCNTLGPLPLTQPPSLPSSCANSVRDAYPLLTQFRLQLPECTYSGDVACCVILHGRLFRLKDRQPVGHLLIACKDCRPRL